MIGRGVGVVPFALVIAFLQSALIEPLGSPALRHLDLPLLVGALVAVSARAGAAGPLFVIGLMVDLHTTRMFGLHALAYTAMAPVAAWLPSAVGRDRTIGSIAVLLVPILVAQGAVGFGAWFGGVVAVDRRLVLAVGWTVVSTAVLAALALRFGPSRRPLR